MEWVTLSEIENFTFYISSSETMRKKSEQKLICDIRPDYLITEAGNLIICEWQQLAHLEDFFCNKLLSLLNHES